MKYSIFICLLIVFVACQKQEKPASDNYLPVVESWKVAKEADTVTIKVHGVTRPKRKVELAFQLAGVIQKVPVELGDIVLENQILASLEDKDLQLQLQRAQQHFALSQSRLAKIQSKARKERLQFAKSKLLAAQKNYQLAQKVYEAKVDLAHSQIISSLNIDELRTSAEVAYEHLKMAQQEKVILEKGASPKEVDVTKQEMGLAQVDINIIQQKLEYTTLHSPFPGVVSSVLVEKGQFVHVGKKVFLIEDFSKIKIETAVPETQVKYVKLGQKAKVVVESISTEPFWGTVSYLSANTDPMTRTFTLEIAMENHSLLLRGGMFAFIELVIANPRPRILLPLKSLKKDEKGMHVMVLKNLSPKGFATAQRQNIKTGKLSRSFIEVTQGLSDGDLVVTNGHHYIQTGEKVRNSRARNSSYD